MKKKIIILIFFIGVALGIGGTIFVPNLIAPYLPEVIHSKGTAVGGVVIAKQQKAAWLLLTVNTPQGAILATFKKKVAEIELLVEKGDTIVLLLREYKPFVDNPIIKQVTKGLAPKVAPVDDLALPPLKKDSSLLLPQSVGKKTIDSKPEMGKAKKPPIGEKKTLDKTKKKKALQNSKVDKPKDPEIDAGSKKPIL